MEFSPNNPIVKLCLQGMASEEASNPEEARKLFLQAWTDATAELEKFIAAWFVARRQDTAADRLAWLERALAYALCVSDGAAQSALPSLYAELATCYADLHEAEQAAEYAGLAASVPDEPSDDGPFYHGTKAQLQPGDLLTAGGASNYKADLIMNHIYFTALLSGAGLAAALARGDGPERIYLVEPTGEFENDPNVTNRKFPGNLTRSYRSESPLTVIREVTDWARQAPEDLHKWRQRVASGEGKIIN
jgi:rifampin ADP-ribosylating transferase